MSATRIISLFFFFFFFYPAGINLLFLQVGSSSELSQRLGEAIDLRMEDLKGLNGQPMHTFDIRRSNSVTELWKRYEDHQPRSVVYSEDGDEVNKPLPSPEDHNPPRGETEGSESFLEAFEAEMAKIMETSESDRERQPEPDEQSPSSGHQSGSNTSGIHPSPADVVVSALQAFTDGAGLIRSGLGPRFPELDQRLHDAQQAIPEHVSAGLQTAFRTLDSQATNVASTLNNVSATLGQTSIPRSTGNSTSAEHSVDGLQSMAYGIGQMGRTLLEAFGNGFGQAESHDEQQGDRENVHDPTRTDERQEQPEARGDSVSRQAADSGNAASLQADEDSNHRPSDSAAEFSQDGLTSRTEASASHHGPQPAGQNGTIQHTMSEDPNDVLLNPLRYPSNLARVPPSPQFAGHRHFRSPPVALPLPVRRLARCLRAPYPAWPSRPARSRPYLDYEQPQLPYDNTPGVSNMLNERTTEGAIRKDSQNGADSDQSPERTLFIGNVGFHVTHKMIQDVCASKGFLVEVELPLDVATQKHAGFGYLHFSSIYAAKAAMEALQGARIDGHSINLEFSDRSPISRIQAPRDATPKVESGVSGGGDYSDLRNPFRVYDSAATLHDSEESKGKTRATNMGFCGQNLSVGDVPLLQKGGPDSDSGESSTTAILDEGTEDPEFSARYPSLVPSADRKPQEDTMPKRLPHLNNPELEMERFPPVSQLEAHLLADRRCTTNPSHRTPTFGSQGRSENEPVASGPVPEARNGTGAELYRSNTVMPTCSTRRSLSPFNTYYPDDVGIPLRRRRTERHNLRQAERNERHNLRQAELSERRNLRHAEHNHQRELSDRTTKPSRRFQRSLAERHDIVNRCATTLVSLGYGKPEDGGLQRIMVYAAAADGKVADAIDMIEEERKAYGR